MDPPRQLDLDRLIGELETESARRRAEPGYPHDADARLHFELARRAPRPSGSEALRDIIATVEEATSLGEGSPTGDITGAGGRGRSERDAVRRQLERIDGRVTALGLAAAAALDAVVGRLEHLEEAVGRLAPHGDDTVAAPATTEGDDALASWRDQLGEGLPTGARVLYAQSRADEVVAELRAAGVDAYGVTSAGSPHQPGPDVRHAEVVDHLRAVADDALGAVVLSGVPDAMTPSLIGPLVAELGRVTTRVVIISEAPWWWRLRVGAVNADLSPGRPLDPDTWLHAFHGVAMVGTAHYAASGRSYRVVVRSEQ